MSAGAVTNTIMMLEVLRDDAMRVLTPEQHERVCKRVPESWRLGVTERLDDARTRSSRGALSRGEVSAAGPRIRGPGLVFRCSSSYDECTGSCLVVFLLVVVVSIDYREIHHVHIQSMYIQSIINKTPYFFHLQSNKKLETTSIFYFKKTEFM